MLDTGFDIASTSPSDISPTGSPKKVTEINRMNDDSNPRPDKGSGFRRCAKASLICSLVAIAAAIALGAVASSQPAYDALSGTRTTTYTLLIRLAIISPLLSITLGAIALSGIGRHGKRGILGNSCTGIILSISLIAFFFLYKSAAEKNLKAAKEMQQMMETQREQVQRLLDEMKADRSKP